MSNIGSWRTSTSKRSKQTDISKVALADSGGGRGYCARAMTAGGFLCERNEGEEGFWRGRLGAGREGVVRGEAGSRWLAVARGEHDKVWAREKESKEERERAEA
jgi:hypothetical protein